jgi:hypothetical protein
MKRMSRVISTMVLLLLALWAAPAAQAALRAFSTAPSFGGMPTWYQDVNGVAVKPCVEAGCGLVAEPGIFNPGLAVAFPGNFPSEGFYFNATTDNFDVGGSTVFVIMALEFTTVSPGGAAGVASTTPGAVTAPFQRLRIVVEPPAGGTIAAGNWTVQHPWGTTTFDSTVDCRNLVQRCRMTRDVPAAGFPPNFPAALGPVAPTADGFSMSSFLKSAAAPPNALGDAVTSATVTGGTLRNSVIVTSPAGAGTITTFIITGKTIGMEVTPSPAAMKAVVGTPTPTTLTVTNLSGAAIDFSAATAIQLDPASPNFSDFALAPPTAGINCLANPNLGFAAGSNTCSFNVVFNPAASAIAARTATVKITPAAGNPNAPPISAALAGTAQFQVTVTVGPNGALQKVLPGGNVAAVSEPADAGSTVKYLAIPNVVVPNVSKFLPVFEVNDVLVRSAADGTFDVAIDDAPKAIDVAFVRPGDVSVDQAGAGDGQVTISDALEALRIVTGLNATPTGEQRVAADVGPLVAGKPAPDGLVDISDVLTILWRVVNPTAPNW